MATSNAIPVCGPWMVEHSPEDGVWTVGRYWAEASELIVTLPDGRHWEPREDCGSEAEALELAAELNG